MLIIAFKRKAKYRVCAAPEVLFNSGSDTLTKVTLVQTLSWGKTGYIIRQACPLSLLLHFEDSINIIHQQMHHLYIIQGAAERSPLFGKLINSKPKKIRQMFSYFWKVHRMPFYINVF
jgi:hypothetical protein